jgi:hypothetical protein
MHADGEHQGIGGELECRFRLVERGVVDHDVRHAKCVADRMEGTLEGQRVSGVTDRSAHWNPITSKLGLTGVQRVLAASNQADRQPPCANRLAIADPSPGPAPTTTSTSGLVTTPERPSAQNALSCRLGRLRPGSVREHVPDEARAGDARVS